MKVLLTPFQLAMWAKDPVFWGWKGRVGMGSVLIRAALIICNLSLQSGELNIWAV